MSRFCKRAGLILIFVTPIALSQQEEEPNLGGEDLLSDEIIFDDNLPLLLSNSSCSLFAEIKAISTPEKKAEKRRKASAVAKSIL